MKHIFSLMIVASVMATPLFSETLTVMSFNIYGGGANDGKPVDETVAAIRAAGADVIGVQETRLESETCTADVCPAQGVSVAKDIADALGFYYYDQTQENAALWANAVISRFPIGAASPHDLGVSIDLNGTTVWIFNIHLDDEPYQPYQALGIEYGPAPFVSTAPELIDWADRTRRPAMDLLMADMAAAGDAIAFVTGDFNEPSMLDWTTGTVAAGLQPVAVAWPATKLLTDAGFADAYREVWPSPEAKPAFTWTPRWTTEDDPTDHHDRIDFVFVRGATATSASIVGEDGPRSDIVVMPWPSDHRAVVATVGF